MKKILLPFIILKNLVVILFEEFVNLFRKLSWTKTIFVLALIGLVVGGVWYWKNKNGTTDPLDKITLEEAAKMGEVTTHKLMVQIETPKGNPEDIKGRYERGDIVLIMPGDREFSDAEKTGFLILKMDITPTQADLLVRSLEKKGKEKDPDGRPMMEQLKRRKYTVDLKKIGVNDGDEKGREMEQIFKWDVVSEKDE